MNKYSNKVSQTKQKSRIGQDKDLATSPVHHHSALAGLMDNKSKSRQLEEGARKINNTCYVTPTLTRSPPLPFHPQLPYIPPDYHSPSDRVTFSFQTQQKQEQSHQHIQNRKCGKWGPLIVRYPVPVTGCCYRVQIVHTSLLRQLLAVRSRGITDNPSSPYQSSFVNDLLATFFFFRNKPFTGNWTV